MNIILQKVGSVQINISYPKSNTICYILITINSWDIGVYYNVAIIVKFWKTQSKSGSKNGKIVVFMYFRNFNLDSIFKTISFPKSPETLQAPSSILFYSIPFKKIGVASTFLRNFIKIYFSTSPYQYSYCLVCKNIS